MAKSKAQKKREKLVREGRRNPENGRNSFSQLDLRTRKTKTKKDHLYRTKHKNRDSKQRENDSFCIYGSIIPRWSKRRNARSHSHDNLNLL